MKVGHKKLKVYDRLIEKCHYETSHFEQQRYMLKVLLTVFPRLALSLSSRKDGLIVNTSFVTGSKSFEHYICDGSLTHQFQFLVDSN